MGATESIAQFVAHAPGVAMPEDVRRKARLALLDCLGVALAGANFPSSRMVEDFVRANGGAPQAGVIGTQLRTSMPDAALANGMLCSALLYEDTSLALPGHSTATLLPVLLALGDALHLPGRALLDAYVIGFEIEAIIGSAIDPEHYERGWHATSTVGSLGAAAAACRLMGLPVEQTRMALGIATSLTGGSRQNFGTMMQAFHSGMAARNGIVAAQLAQRGFTADASILESRMGFCALYGAGAEKLDAALPKLGCEFALSEQVLYMKLYPCGFPLQRPIDCALDLAAAHNLEADNIAAIRCGVHYLIPETVFHENPQTGLEGRTSIPYCVARAILDRRMGLAQFTDEKVSEPAACELMAKVRVHVPPELSREALRGKVGAIAAPATMDITLRDGRTLSTRAEYFRGASERPLSRDEVVDKFRECAGSVLDAKRVEAVRDAVEHIERLQDAAQLTALLVP